MNIAQIRMGQGTVLRWVFWVILLLQVGIFVTSMPQSASAATKRYPIGPQGELQITLQEEWKGVLKPSRPNLPLTIEISPGVGDAFLFLLTPLAASNKQSSDGADSRFLVERMSAPAVEQSVEKRRTLGLSMVNKIRAITFH